MQQVLQSLRDGQTSVAEVPAPLAGPGEVLIASSVSLISSGTERMLQAFGRANPLEKMRQQPDKVRLVLDKVQSDGLATTLDSVRSKLAQPLATGYCNVGRVIALGDGVSGLAIGDRVASNGRHAGVNAVPRNLCAQVPDGVSDDAAAFTVPGAIALQGVRLVNPSVGECVVVTGLGLIGLLCVQVLRAQGCRVLGLDPDADRRALARRFGAETAAPDPQPAQAAARRLSRGRGVDAVILTAATRSSAPVSQAAHMCRKRGRIVLVGVTGLDLDRADFYEKELTFQVSCSYSPGRYDPAYELQGQDYPVGFVRWTAQRNFEAVLDLMAQGALDPLPLISRRYPVCEAADAMAHLARPGAAPGLLLDYPDARREAPPERRIALRSTTRPATGNVGFIGAGNHAARVLLPTFGRAQAHLHSIAAPGGLRAAINGRRFGFAQALSDPRDLLAEDAVDTVVIATRHDSHAELVLAALRAGKHVYVEKPLCLSLDELRDIRDEAANRPDQHLMVGFNRRFAPQIRQMKSLLDPLDAPMTMIATINAGALPADHWLCDPQTGGGRLLGEACHFIDLLRHLADAPVVEHAARTSAALPDNASLFLRFADGSTGHVHYLANGHRRLAKERIEVFAAGRVLQLDNFRRLRGWGWRSGARAYRWRQDKGQQACAQAFMDAVRSGGPTPIPREQVFEIAAVTLDLAGRGGERAVEVASC